MILEWDEVRFAIDIMGSRLDFEMRGLQTIVKLTHITGELGQLGGYKSSQWG